MITLHAHNFRRSRVKISALLLASLMLSLAMITAAQKRPAPPTGRTANFSGLWVEIVPTPAAIKAGARPLNGPPVRLTLTQQGAQLEIRLSYNPKSAGTVFGIATIQGETATWRGEETCGPGNQKPGFNYDHPGFDVFTLALMHPIDGGPSAPQLMYTQGTTWNVPCDGVPAGTQTVSKVLARPGS
jgi:hypothetical protein